MAIDSTPAQPVLSCRDLVCFLGEDSDKVTAVDGVSLSVNAGEIISVVGPSGCGKSTLLYALGLLDTVTSGRIEIAGQSVPEDEPARAALRNTSIGFVFQFHYLLGEFSALENVLLPMRKKAGKLSAADKDRGRELLVSVGLEARLHRPAMKLSGGERQRVALARALANNPVALLADEPTGNLDHANSERVFELLHKSATDHAMGILMVTHNKALAQQADRRMHMLDGRFV